MKNYKEIEKRLGEVEKQLLRVVDIMSRLISREYGRDVKAFCDDVLPYSGDKRICTDCGGTLVVNGTRRVAQQPGSDLWTLIPDQATKDHRTVLRLVCDSCFNTKHMWPNSL